MPAVRRCKWVGQHCGRSIEREPAKAVALTTTALESASGGNVATMCVRFPPCGIADPINAAARHVVRRKREKLPLLRICVYAWIAKVLRGLDDGASRSGDRRGTADRPHHRRAPRRVRVMRSRFTLPPLARSGAGAGRADRPAGGSAAIVQGGLSRIPAAVRTPRAGARVARARSADASRQQCVRVRARRARDAFAGARGTGTSPSTSCPGLPCARLCAPAARGRDGAHRQYRRPARLEADAAVLLLHADQGGPVHAPRRRWRRRSRRASASMPSGRVRPCERAPGRRGFRASRATRCFSAHGGNAGGDRRCRALSRRARAASPAR